MSSWPADSVRADHHLERWIVAHRAGWLDPVFVDLTRVGTSGLVWLALALALALRWRRPSIFVLTAIADGAADLFASLIKDAVARPRPRLDALVALPHTHSFPSGHAATSFACATVLAVLVPRVRIPAFVLAAAIGYSRLYVGVHYPLDVLAGAVLGVGVGCALLWTVGRAAPGGATGLRRFGRARRRPRRAPRSG
jgi:undecaprenyl-diphosphatase